MVRSGEIHMEISWDAPSAQVDHGGLEFIHTKKRLYNNPCLFKENYTHKENVTLD